MHPTEIAYNVYTAREAIKRLDRDDWGFNFDPSHLVWQMIDPVVFIKEFGDRILHVHAKDWELQKDILHIDGVTGTGSWQRKDRAARYRVPGWGDVEWRRVITALLEVGYDFVLCFEHEDPVMSRGGRLRAGDPVPQAAHHQEAARAGPGVVAGVQAGRPGQEGDTNGGRAAGRLRDDGRRGEPRATCPSIGIGMLGYAFMGKAHTNALKKMPTCIWPPPSIPRLVAISGRDEEAVEEAAKPLRLREVLRPTGRTSSTTPTSQVFDNGGPNDIHLEPTIAAAEGGQARHLREAAGARPRTRAYEIWKGVASTGVKHSARSTTGSSRRSGSRSR